MVFPVSRFRDFALRPEKLEIRVSGSNWNMASKIIAEVIQIWRIDRRVDKLGCGGNWFYKIQALLTDFFFHRVPIYPRFKQENEILYRFSHYLDWC